MFNLLLDIYIQSQVCQVTTRAAVLLIRSRSESSFKQLCIPQMQLPVGSGSTELTTSWQGIGETARWRLGMGGIGEDKTSSRTQAKPFILSFVVTEDVEGSHEGRHEVGSCSNHLQRTAHQQLNCRDSKNLVYDICALVEKNRFMSPARAVEKRSR
jgi:hypothetical protein